MTSSEHSTSSPLLPQTERHTHDGYEVQWYRWTPAQPPLGAFLFLHGQGDYGERYQEIAEVFLKNRISFVSFDLPGHGQSTGIRGHVPSFSFVQNIVSNALTDLRHRHPELPVGLGGHSAGGLLTLNLLSHLEPSPDFAWINSPLLKAELNQAKWKIVLLRYLANILPKLPVSTGVTASQCRVYLEGESAFRHLRFHNFVSLQWARELITIADLVREHPERLPPTCHYFFSQGEKDSVCPLHYWESLTSRLTLPYLTTKVFAEARHEPFADHRKEETFEVLGAWLQETLNHLGTSRDT